MPKFSRKGLNSRKPWTSVLEHCNDLFPCKRSDVWFELILSECVAIIVRWFEPCLCLIERWIDSVFPRKNWLLWLLTWTVISFWLELLVQCGLTHLFDLWWWTYFLAIVWIFDRWIASVFPRTLFEFRSMKWFSDSMFELWLLTWTNISFWSMTWTFIPAVWFMIVDLFPCKWLNFDRTMNWCNIPANNVWFGCWLEQLNFHRWFEPLTECLNFDQWLEPLFLSERLNFDRWIESIFPRNCWLEPLTERLNFDRWIESIFPRNCWLEPLFLSERLNFNRWIESIFPRNCWLGPLFLSKRLNFQRWFEPIFPRNCWLERTFEFSSLIWTECLIDHWIDSVFPRQFWFDLVDLHSYSQANVWILIQ